MPHIVGGVLRLVLLGIAPLLAIQAKRYARARSPVRVFGRLCASVAQGQHCHRAERLVQCLGDVARQAWSPERWRLVPHRVMLLVVATSSMGVRVRSVAAPCARSVAL
jgi:hypothetical protein